MEAVTRLRKLTKWHRCGRWDNLTLTLMWDLAGEMSALEEVVAQLLVRQPAPLLRPLHLQVTVAVARCVYRCSASAGASACCFTFHPPCPWAITLDA